MDNLYAYRDDQQPSWSLGDVVYNNQFTNAQKMN